VLQVMRVDSRTMNHLCQAIGTTVPSKHGDLNMLILEKRCAWLQIISSSQDITRTDDVDVLVYVDSLNVTDSTETSAI